MKELLRKLAVEEEGAAMVEYVLLAALIAVVCIGTVTAIGQGANFQFGKVSAALPST